MTEISNNDGAQPEYERIISRYSDDELKTVLKKRKLYQKDAADFAIQEAIRRGLINSEHDLIISREFKHEPEKFSIFPNIENEKARAKFKRSIARSLLLIGVLPLIWGGIQIFESQSLEGILVFVFGAIWSLSAFKLMKTIDIKLVYLLFFMTILSSGFLIRNMIKAHSLTTIDILVVIIAVGYVLYAIGFIKKLKD